MTTETITVTGAIAPQGSVRGGVQGKVALQGTAIGGAPGAGVPPGGKKGQVLAKLSNADRDDGWVMAAPVGVNSLNDDGTTITLDLAERKKIRAIQVDGNRILTAINGTADMDGDTILLEITQGAPGGWLVIFDTMFIFSTDIPSPLSLSPTAGAVDTIGLMYRHGIGLRVVGYTRGFSA